MIIEVPDDAYCDVNIHANSRAHVKDMQAQFPDVTWRHEMIPWIDRDGSFPTVKGRAGNLTITIYPNTRNK